MSRLKDLLKKGLIKKVPKKGYVATSNRGLKYLKEKKSGNAKYGVVRDGDKFAKNFKAAREAAKARPSSSAPKGKVSASSSKGKVSMGHKPPVKGKVNAPVSKGNANIQAARPAPKQASQGLGVTKFNRHATPKLHAQKADIMSNKVKFPKPGWVQGTKEAMHLYSPYLPQQQQVIGNYAQLADQYSSAQAPYSNPNKALEHVYQQNPFNDNSLDLAKQQYISGLNRNLSFDDPKKEIEDDLYKRIFPSIQSQYGASTGSINSSALQQAQNKAKAMAARQLGDLRFQQQGLQQQGLGQILNYQQGQQQNAVNLAGAVSQGQNQLNNQFYTQQGNYAQLGLKPAIETIHSPSQPSTLMSFGNAIAQGVGNKLGGWLG